MKKFFAVALVTLLFFTQAVYADMPPELPVLSEDSYRIGASLPVTEILIGDEVYVNIEIDSAPTARAFEIVAEYDTAYLEYKSVSVDITDGSPIEIEQTEDGRLLFAFTTVNDETIKSSGRLCTINFTALKNGKTNVVLKSVKTVFDDMKYISYSDLDKSVSITLGKEEPKKPIGGSGGGGGGGGGFYVKKPTEPEPDKEADKQAETTPDDNDTAPTEQEQLVIPEDKVKFTDLDEDFWGYEYIIELVGRGVVNGYEDGSFKPNSPITRAEFAKILVVAAGLTYDETTKNPFADVNASDWFAEYVITAARLGIFNGDERGCFNPNQNITREDAATALSRYIDTAEIEIEESKDVVPFADENMISDYAKEHIDRLFSLGIVNGDDNNRFYPQNNITRAEAAAMIYRTIIR